MDPFLLMDLFPLVLVYSIFFFYTDQKWLFNRVYSTILNQNFSGIQMKFFFKALGFLKLMIESTFTYLVHPTKEILFHFQLKKKNSITI